MTNFFKSLPNKTGLVWKSKYFKLLLCLFFIAVIICGTYTTLGLNSIISEKSLQNASTIGERHINIIIGLVPASSLVILFLVEILWLLNMDSDPQILIWKRWIFSIFALITIFVLSLFYPWKFLSPILTIVTAIILPLIVNKDNSDKEDCRTNSELQPMDRINFKKWEIRHDNDLILTFNSTGLLLITPKNQLTDKKMTSYFVLIEEDEVTAKHNSLYKIMIESNIITITKQ